MHRQQCEFKLVFPVIKHFCYYGDHLELVSIYSRYEIMDSCWALDPALRPSFSHLKEQLERLYQSFVEEIDT